MEHIHKGAVLVGQMELEPQVVLLVVAVQALVDQILLEAVRLGLSGPVQRANSHPHA